MKTVAHVITGLTAGGAEMMLWRLAARFDRQRRNLVVVSLTDRGIYGERIEAEGVPVVTLGMQRGRPSLAALWRLARLLRDLRPALVQGWMYHANLAVTLAARLARLNAPVLWNVRASLRDSGRDKAATALAIRGGATLSGAAAGIIYNAAASARQHESIGFRADRTHVIPNGFDCTHYRPDTLVRAAARAELGIAPDELLVGCFGRDDPMKDHRAFVAAAAIARERNHRLRFIIAGEGMDAGNAAIAAAIRDHGLDGGVMRLLGECDDLARLYPALDLCCLSSAWGEGFPNVLGEAMACGVPCVTTDTGDSGAIVGATGRVVAPRDVGALAAALVELAGDTDLRSALGRAARQRVVDTWSIEAVLADYERYYDRFC